MTTPTHPHPPTPTLNQSPYQIMLVVAAHREFNIEVTGRHAKKRKKI
jgi:hypothetical protein